MRSRQEMMVATTPIPVSHILKTNSLELKFRMVNIFKMLRMLKMFRMFKMFKVF